MARSLAPKGHASHPAGATDQAFQTFAEQIEIVRKTTSFEAPAMSSLAGAPGRQALIRHLLIVVRVFVYFSTQPVEATVLVSPVSTNRLVTARASWPPLLLLSDWLKHCSNNNKPHIIGLCCDVTMVTW